MKRVLTGALLALAITLPAQAQDLKPRDRGSPIKSHHEYVQLFDELVETVGKHFYDPYFHGADWNAIVAEHRPQLRGVRSDEDFHRLAKAMLAKVRSSHLDIRMPADSPARTVGIGAQFRQIGEELVITHVDPLSDARRQGLRPGQVLLTPIDQLQGAVGSTASPRVRTCTGQERVVAVRRESMFWPPQRPSFRWYAITTAPDKRIGYLRADRFDDGDAELADKAMADLADTDALIIDIRQNSGGNASALRLASYFTDGAVPSIVLLTREWLDRLGRPVTAQDVLAAPRADRIYTDAQVFEAVQAGGGGVALWTEDVGDRRYRKPVIVLIGEDTGSAGEGFAWHMRLKTEATLMGRKTAGALLSSERIEIGDGWTLVLPVHGIWAPDGGNYGDKPVPPHVVVPQSRNDLCAGRDPELEAAIDRLMGRRG